MKESDLSVEGIRGGQHQPKVTAGTALPSHAGWGRARDSQPNYCHVRKELLRKLCKML